MKDSFDCTVRTYIPSIKEFAAAHVVVHLLVVTLHDPKTLQRLGAGIWDAGGYVQYPRSHELCIHPVLLDEVDAELRLRMARPGRQPTASPRRASAVGYQDG